ncbi:MAG: tetratricopeptide repeat protein [Akkermansiaceae bacterium]
MITRFLAVLFLTCSCLSAHDSPQHDVDKLTVAIRQHPKSPHLYHKRGIAYMALGRLDPALTDFRIAFKLDPNSRAHQLSLAELYLLRDEAKSALTMAKFLIKSQTNRHELAVGHVIAAEAYTLAERPHKSLPHLKLAFTAYPKGEIEWFLLRSENQRALNLHPQRIADLATGKKIHHSAVLHSHWVDALIDGQHYALALKVIDRELRSRRWKSSWLVKRSRALIGLNRQREANSCLYAGLAEIKHRQNPQRPDLTLLADQAHIYHLMGNRSSAKACLKKLKYHRAPRWLCCRIESLIK